MNFQAIKNVVTSKAGRQLLTLQKNSPTLMFGAGVVGVVATAVMASKATLKLDGILEDHQKDLQDLENVKPVMDDETHTKTKALIYTKTTVNMTKAYAPAVLIGICSIGLLTGSHIQLTRRNAGLMAAYAAVDKGFKEYRARVMEDLGEEKDREYRYGITETEIVEQTDKGEKTRTVKTASDKSLSPYAKIFDEHSTSWSQTPPYNLLFIKCQQDFANDKLRARGHVFLNEIYDALGLDRTKEGALVGWVLGADGDNYIDFGVFNNEMEPKHLDFIAGREGAIWLDFNVDGVIYDKI